MESEKTIISFGMDEYEDMVKELSSLADRKKMPHALFMSIASVVIKDYMEKAGIKLKQSHLDDIKN